jgi:hypothetical protein
MAKKDKEKKEPISDETKMKLFQEMLRLEHLGETKTYDGRNYVDQSDGAFEMLKILGLATEYIKWALGK